MDKIIKLNETDLRSLVNETVKRLLSEMSMPSSPQEKYYYMEIGDLNMAPIEPVLILTESNIEFDEDDDTCYVYIDGEEVDCEYNTNLYALDNSVPMAEPGDYVFEIAGSYTLYRQGVGMPSIFEGVPNLNDTIIGTKQDFINYFNEYQEELASAWGIDVQEAIARLEQS